MGHFKISKKILRPDAQTLELLLTSVMLSRFHRNFRWVEHKHLKKIAGEHIYHNLVAVRTERALTSNRS